MHDEWHAPNDTCVSWYAWQTSSIESTCKQATRYSLNDYLQQQGLSVSEGFPKRGFFSNPILIYLFIVNYSEPTSHFCVLEHMHDHINEAEQKNAAQQYTTEDLQTAKFTKVSHTKLQRVVVHRPQLHCSSIKFTES